MTTTITKNNGRQLARPPKELVPLIKDDLKQGEEAGIPYYTAAGEKLIEAKSQMNALKWGDWLAKNFHLSKSTAYTYMELARKSGLGQEFETLSEVKEPNREAHHRPGWHTPVQEQIRDTREKFPVWNRHYELKREERAAERKLGLRLIKIGFKILSVELHPDKGGSHDAMRRLNAVRRRLEAAA